MRCADAGAMKWISARGEEEQQGRGAGVREWWGSPFPCPPFPFRVGWAYSREYTHTTNYPSAQLLVIGPPAWPSG